MKYPPWPPKWRHRLAIALIMALTWVPAIIPIKWARSFGRLAGALFFSLFRRRRLIAVDNIIQAQAAGALPPGLDPTKTARQSFQLQGQAVMEDFRLLHGRLREVLPDIEFSGLNNYQEAWRLAKARGVGIMLITGHTGNWELTGQAVPVLLEFTPTVVGRTQNSPVSDWLVMAIRTSNGNKQIYKHGAGRRMLETLKNGRCLVLLIDQAAIVGKEGLPVNFLGRPAMTNAIPARLARKLGAVVLPGFGVWDGLNHKIIFYPPFILADNPKNDLADDLGRLNQPLEDLIRRYPDQWLWGHRRWKTRESVVQERRQRKGRP